MTPQNQPNYKLSLFFALSLHLILLFLLLAHFRLSDSPSYTVPTQKIIKANAVSSSQLKTQVEQFQAEKQLQQEQEQQAQLEKQQVVQSQQMAAQKAQEQAQKHAEAAAQQKMQQQQIAKQLAAEKLAKQKALADQKQKQLALTKKIAAQQIQQALQADQAKQKVVTKQKQSDTAKLAAKKATQQLLQQEISSASDSDDQPAAQSSVDQGMLDKYKALLIQAISQQWIVPDTAKKDEETKLLIHIAPGGMVLSVEIAKSSGDPVLDRSAQTAVLKASPLPVPKDAAEFENFRTLSLTVRPEGIV